MEYQHEVHGARWMAFDFHTHSPASNDYAKQNVTSDEWVEAALESGIDCVALTDHNSGEWIRRIQNASDGTDLTVFPGTEISVSGNVHLLAIFGPDSHKQSHVTGLLDKLGIDPNDFGDPSVCTEASLTDSVREIRKRGGVAVPAHVYQSKGLFESLGGATLENFSEREDLLALEVREVDETPPEVFTKHSPDYARVIGSDAHTPAAIGREKTFVKLESPTITGLGLALHDRRHGVLRGFEASEEDLVPSSEGLHLQSVKVSEGYKAGRGEPLTVHFSPWLTSVIGGFGTGKSALLKYLRIAFKKHEDLPAPIADDFDRFNQIGSRNDVGMLTEDTEVKVKFIYNGEQRTLRWSYKDEWELFEGGSCDSESRIDSGKHIPDGFKIEIFGQKELHAMSNTPGAVLQFLDSKLPELDGVEEELENLEDELADHWRRKRAFQRDLDNLDSLQLEMAEIDTRLSGLGEDVEDVISKWHGLNELENEKGDALSKLEAAREALSDTANALRAKIPERLMFDSEWLKDEEEAELESAQSSVEEIGTKVDDLVDELEGVIGEVAESIETGERLNELENRFSELAGDDEEGPVSSDLKDVLDRKRQVGQRVDELEKVQNRQGEAENEIEEAIADVRAQYERRFNLRKDLIGEINSEARGIRLTCIPFGGVRTSEDEFRQIIERENGRFSSDIVGEEDGDGILSGMTGTSFDSAWENRCDQIERVLTATEDSTNDFDTRLARHFAEWREESPEKVARLAGWAPEDKVKVEVRTDGGFDDVQHGSDGQKCAAMLSLVVGLIDAPLVIDQPEDDLDSRLISETLVEQLRSLKQDTQICVITHNPNIPVNAASEAIVEMTFRNGQIYENQSGALQERAIRNAVCEVLEGGRQALDRRYFRIVEGLTR